MPQQRSTHRAAQRAMPGHILVVDDEAAVLLTLGAILERAGYTVTLAMCGADAVRELGEQRFDLLVLDLIMPELSGREVAACAAELQPDVPVMLLTGHSSWEPATAPITPNVVDFLLKTSDPSLVVERIAAALKQVGSITASML